MISLRFIFLFTVIQHPVIYLLLSQNENPSIHHFFLEKKDDKMQLVYNLLKKPM